MKKKEVAKANLSSMRRFVLVRKADVSGVSGTGVVAEGVVLSCGMAVLSWLTVLHSVAIYHSLDVLEKVHSHEGATRVEWVDETD